MAIAGKGTLFKVSTTAGGAGTYTAAADIRSASMNLSAATLDVTAMNDSQISRILGLKDATYSISGYWKSSDSTGQVALRSALVNDSEVWVQFLPDGSTGFKQQVKVSKWDITAAVDGLVGFSAELEGTGTISAV